MSKLNHIAVLLCLCLLLGACSATNRLTMGAVEPAPVFVPKNITRVAIINRSQASEKNEAIDKIDRVLSAEGMQLDKNGAAAAVDALQDELSMNDRFESVVIIDSLGLESKGLGVFPASLDWNYTRELCEQFGVDAIFALEFYDTDTQVSYAMTTRALPNSFGIKVNVPYHKVTLLTSLRNGWRIYDPYDKVILDAFETNSQITSSGEGLNPVKALEAVNGREAAVIEQSKFLGQQYAGRLQPIHKRIARDYFVKGTGNFEIAKRRAQTGDWDGAAALWEKELGHPKAKIAGRACYNMAIINEINGDLDKAVEWASKSYADYRTREALHYLDLLNYRIAEQAALQRQLAR